MAPPPRLSNCFIPAVADADASDANYSSKSVPTTTDDDDLRPIRIQTNILPSAAGSALVQHGNSHVLCSVIGPTASQVIQKQQVPLDVGEGTLLVEVKYLLPPLQQLQPNADSSSTELNAQQQNRHFHQATQHMEQQLSQQVLACVQPILPLHTFPKSAITVRIDVWHNDDENLLTTALLAAVTALATTRGMELYNLVTACTVAVLDDGRLILDPPAVLPCSTTAVVGSVTLAVVPPSSVCSWEQRGRIPTPTAASALQLCREGCQRWHKVLRSYLVQQAKQKQQEQQQQQ